MRRFVFLFLFAILTGSTLWCEGGEYPSRLFYVSSKLENDGDVGKISSVVKSAASTGFNGMVFSSPGLERFGVEFSDYTKRLKEVARVCNENNIEIIPMIFSLNSDDSTVFTDKNLAEGMLVKEAPFIVWNGDAVLVPDQSVRFPNGGFEDYVGDQVKLCQLQDISVQVVFADKVVYKEGKTSLRFEKHEQDAGTKGYVAQDVRVKPYRSYKITVWVKAEDLKPATSFLPQVHGKDSRILMELNPVVPSGGNWRKMTFGFNSYDNETVKVYLGLADWVSGKLWLDDVNIEEVAPLNVLSRPGTPVVVRNKKTGAAYEESYDFAPIVDSKMNFRFDHEEPLVKIVPNSNIKDDDRLLVSYYQGIALHESQVTFCMSEPKLYEIWRYQAHAIHDAIAPHKYFLNVTQVRAGGSCETCKQRGISVAQILGDCITRQAGIVRELDPNAEIFIWSDMLDSNHNARNNYYLVDGDLTGSWNYIPKDLTIVCWYHKLRQETMNHFSSLGFKTLACIHSDKGADDVRDWLQVMKNTSGVSGAMYTSFENDYTKLASFGRTVFSGDGEEGWLDVPVKQADVHGATSVAIALEKDAEVKQSQITAKTNPSTGVGKIISVSSSEMHDKEHEQASVPVSESEAAGKPGTEVAASVQTKEQPSVVSATTVTVSSEKNQQVTASSGEDGIITVSSSTAPDVVSKTDDTDKPRVEASTPITVSTGDGKNQPSLPSSTPEKTDSEQKKIAGNIQSEASTENQDNKAIKPEGPSIQTQANKEPSPSLHKAGGMGVVFGLVSGNDDETINGVKIKIDGADFSDYTLTDEDGFFEFSNLAAGSYTITQEKDDYQTQKIIINLEQGEVVDLGTVTMGTTKSYIYGYTRDSIRGNPVGTATIKLLGLKTKLKKTSFSDADGFFKFADLGEDTYLLIARKRGFKRLNRTIRLGKGEERELELEMRTRIRREKEAPKVTIESNNGKVLEEE